MDAATLIKNVFKALEKEAKRKKPLVAWHRVKHRACSFLGISRRTLNRSLDKEGETESSDEAIESNKPGPAKNSLQRQRGYPDSFDRNTVKRRALSIIAENRTLTLKSLKEQLEKDGLSLSKYKLWKTLHYLGFQYGKTEARSKQALLERADLAQKRFCYLRKIKEMRQLNKPIVYLDETWVDSHTTPSRQWLAPPGEGNRKLPTNRGQRFVILHCGSEQTGFLQGCDLVFLCKSNDGRDYHSEMNGKIFNEWVTNTLTPALPANSVIVMDNASYHSMQAEGTKAPTTATKKQDMINWLKDRDIAVDCSLTKPKIYELVKKQKEEAGPIFSVDSFLQCKGHQVLRLPPYHCELNPIELIWADLKHKVASENSSFKNKDVRELISYAINGIDQTRWANACRHVKRIEDSWWQKDNLQPQQVQPVIIPLESDSDSESSSDYE